MQYFFNFYTSLLVYNFVFWGRACGTTSSPPRDVTVGLRGYRQFQPSKWGVRTNPLTNSGPVVSEGY